MGLATYKQIVLAAAGNQGPAAESITVPGNDPYLITVGAIDPNHTAQKFGDDHLAARSSTGPTLHSFIKPDLLAPGKDSSGTSQPTNAHLARSLYAGYEWV